MYLASEALSSRPLRVFTSGAIVAKSEEKYKKSTLPKDIEIGRRIRAQRLNRRMIQTDLGNRLGVTPRQIQKYEQGVNRRRSARADRESTRCDTGVLL
jgi:DNA-binding transcriptional regulator YiaG